jgi:hypothetical protein
MKGNCEDGSAAAENFQIKVTSYNNPNNNLGSKNKNAGSGFSVKHFSMKESVIFSGVLVYKSYKSFLDKINNEEQAWLVKPYYSKIKTIFLTFLNYF